MSIAVWLEAHVHWLAFVILASGAMMGKTTRLRVTLLLPAVLMAASGDFEATEILLALLLWWGLPSAGAPRQDIWKRRMMVVYGSLLAISLYVWFALNHEKLELSAGSLLAAALILALALPRAASFAAGTGRIADYVWICGAIQLWAIRSSPTWDGTSGEVFMAYTLLAHGLALVSRHEEPGNTFALYITLIAGQLLWVLGALGGHFMHWVPLEGYAILLMAALFLQAFSSRAHLAQQATVLAQQATKDFQEQRIAELETLNGSLHESRRMQRENAVVLEDLSAEKSLFLSAVTHSFRVPLHSIIGFGSLLAESPDPVTAEYSTDIIHAAEHLDELVQEIVDIARVEEGLYELEPDLCQLHELLQISLRIIKERALRAGVQLSPQLDDSLPALWVDRRKIKQIVFNLLSNAIKFTPRGGSVQLILQRLTRKQALTLYEGAGHIHQAAPLEPGESYIAIAVQDTGVGMTPEEKGKLFRAYAQTEAGAQRQDSTGLGLILCKTLSELHGGGIAVTSTKNHGSCFTVLLPESLATAAPHIKKHRA